MSNKIQQEVGILGAGIAGLVAGLELLRKGCSVTIYEARSNSGGRIQSLEWQGMVVETGPEFIHGRLQETLALLRKYQIHFEPVNGKMYHLDKGKLEETNEMAEGWGQLLDKMKILKTDLPFREFLEIYFPGKVFDDLRQAAIGFAEGFDLADPDTASTWGLIKEWENEESEQYRIPSGYQTLIKALENEFLQNGGKILFDHPIGQVNWVEKNIYLEYRESRHRADKLIVTLPLSLLNNSAPDAESISFFPPAEEKKSAFRQIGFGTVVKLVMIWDKTFWTSMLPDAQFIFSENFIPTWWTQYPQNLPMLTGWLGGPKAIQFANEPESFFLQKAIESLALIFSLSEEEINKGLIYYKVFNWKQEPFSRGAYSYSLVGSEQAKAIYRRPIQDRIYFSGEAAYEGPYPGTVEAAVVSALETVRSMSFS
jgi:monoamine oxidase